MREILFRGFTPDENGRETITVNGKQIRGEWVQGSYWELRETTYCFQSDYDRHPDNTKHYIVFDKMTDWGLPNRHLQADVIPETVGQFTGLTDKNGKKIFEGDIVEGHLHSRWKHDIQRCEIAYSRDGFEARHHVICGGEPRYYTYKVLFSKDVVVIGNIHDNPELLEVE